MSEAKSLSTKLLEAQQSVEAVVKTGHNSEQGYRYATAADVVTVARKALHEAGLVPSIIDVFDIACESYDRGGTKARGFTARVRIALAIADPETNQAMEFIGAGMGADFGGGDKAILKAQTAATKYAYAGALALPFADHDPERDVPGEAGRLPEQKADPETALPDERVAELAKLYKASGFTFDRFSTAIGAVGGEAPKINRKDSIRKSVASLTGEQADKLANILDAGAEGKA